MLARALVTADIDASDETGNSITVIDREHEAVTNIWRKETPANLRQLDMDQLVAMHDRVSKAVQALFDEEDTEPLGILLPLERKLMRGTGATPALQGREDVNTVL